MYDNVLREGNEVVARARGDAARRAAEIGRPDLADDVALVVSELVTNAVLHGGGCTGVDIVATSDGVRVEVHDPSPVPPVFGHASDESLTGRGVRIVARVADRLGVEPRGDGKTVWVEVTGRPQRLDSGVSEDELLAMWGDEWDAADDERRYPVEIGDVPTDLLLAAKSHVDNVVRELTLAASGAASGVTTEVPAHLVALLDAVHRFAEARLAIKRQALEAASRAAPTARLMLELPVRLADVAEAYLHALDEVDGYCRAMRLLTLETPPQHRLFRHWYIGEVVTQLRAAATGAPHPDPQPFERRLLAELDRVAIAQRVSERGARLYSVAAALATAASPEAVAEAVLTEGVAALRATGGGLLLATDADRLALPGAVGYDDDVVARLRSESPDAELPAAAALRTGEPVWLESRAERTRRFPGLEELEANTVSLCAVPLEVEGRRVGALRFSFNEARLFDEDERRFVLTLAALAAQALDRTQLHHERLDASRRLQRSLLPRALPDIPGVEVAATYRPFGDGMEVGGDFYDVWPIGPQRWAVAVGDAAGTGPEAAAVTAMVRYTLRALAMNESSPAQILQSLNAALYTEREDERFCTVLFGVVEVGDDVHLRVASGGHPPLFVQRADGAIEAVLVGGWLLGVFDDIDVQEVDVRLASGDTALLLTDGVLEARAGDHFFDVAGIERVLSTTRGTAQDVATALEEAVLRHSGNSLTDDIAAVVLHVTE